MESPNTKIERYLDENGVPYESIEHAPAASAEEYNRTLNTRYSQQVKVLLLRYKGNGDDGYVVAAIQGHKKADLERLREILGAKKLRMADKDQLFEVTGCRFGELHPFAKLFGLKLLMDREFLSEQKVFINAGRLDYSITIDPVALQKLEEPVFF